jgi:hypothetical protein
MAPRAAGEELRSRDTVVGRGPQRRDASLATPFQLKD